jgi:hypothetical protein
LLNKKLARVPCIDSFNHEKWLQSPFSSLTFYELKRKKETPRLEISKRQSGYSSPKEKHLSASISKMSNPNVLNITWTSYYKLSVHIIHSQSSMTQKYDRFNPGMSQVNYFTIPKNRINDQTIQLIFAR